MIIAPLVCCSRWNSKTIGSPCRCHNASYFSNTSTNRWYPRFILSGENVKLSARRKNSAPRRQEGKVLREIGKWRRKIQLFIFQIRVRTRILYDWEVYKGSWQSWLLGSSGSPTSSCTFSRVPSPLSSNRSTARFCLFCVEWILSRNRTRGTGP